MHVYACVHVCMGKNVAFSPSFLLIAGWVPLQGRRNSLCPATRKGLLILCQHRRNWGTHLSLPDQMPNQWHLGHLCHAKPHPRF